MPRPSGDSAHVMPMTRRDRFLAACKREPTDRPPVWIMRQAGRYLPEYRQLRSQHSFIEMVRTPELAEEVTLQPLRRFPLDAAIVFSDILVVPEALGQPYHFKDKGGIGMDFTVETEADVRKLTPQGAVERLDYVSAALQRLRKQLGDTTALLGFGGSPWTLAVYMVNGGSDPSCGQLKAMATESPQVFNHLMEMLVDTLAGYFCRQIEAGADAIQIFDSWGQLCPGLHYQEWSLRWIEAIISRLPATVPIIVYAKGMAPHLGAIAATGASVASIDWSTPIAAAHDSHGDAIALQGNLDPVFMSLSPATAAAETRAILDSMTGRDGFIFNLGHGILPSARIETVERVVATVTESCNPSTSS